MAKFDAGDEWEGDPLQQALRNCLEPNRIAGAAILEGVIGGGGRTVTCVAGGSSDFRVTGRIPFWWSTMKPGLWFPLVRSMIATGIVLGGRGRESDEDVLA